MGRGGVGWFGMRDKKRGTGDGGRQMGKGKRGKANGRLIGQAMLREGGRSPRLDRRLGIADGNHGGSRRCFASKSSLLCFAEHPLPSHSPEFLSRALLGDLLRTLLGSLRGKGVRYGPCVPFQCRGRDDPVPTRGSGPSTEPGRCIGSRVGSVSLQTCCLSMGWWKWR